MNQRLIASAIVATSLSVAAAARGQAAPPQAAPQGPRQAAGPQPNTQAVMQADGGSLLQATAAPPDNAPGTDPAGHAQSISLFGVPDVDPHVLKKHDLVNIVVREQSTSATGGQSNQQRAVDFDAKEDAFVRFKLASASLYGLVGNNLPEAKFEGQRDFQGTGEYDRSDSMTTRLEAEVIDVKPNGTLVLQARRHMRIDEEEINVTLTGVCRVLDVDATDSVLSTNLHDLNLQKNTTGQVHDTTKRGLIHQILDFINPF